MASVSDTIAAARGLLQDTNAASYRFPDTALVEGLNFGLNEMRRLRFDLFIGVAAQSFGSASGTVNIPDTYQPALVNLVAGRVMLRDHDGTDTERATALLKYAHAQLTSLGA